MNDGMPKSSTEEPTDLNRWAWAGYSVVNELRARTKTVRGGAMVDCRLAAGKKTRPSIIRVWLAGKSARLADISGVKNLFRFWSDVS
jgi:hypothetical protein